MPNCHVCDRGFETESAVRLHRRRHPGQPGPPVPEESPSAPSALLVRLVGQGFEMVRPADQVDETLGVIAALRGKKAADKVTLTPLDAGA